MHKELVLEVTPKPKPIWLKKILTPLTERTLKRTLQKELVDEVAKLVLEGRFEPGDVIYVACQPTPSYSTVHKKAHKPRVRLETYLEKLAYLTISP